MKSTYDISLNKSFIFLVATLFISTFIAIKQPNIIANIENVFNDIFIKIAANKNQENRIAIIDIDEQSLSEIGPWPWPRETIADLIEFSLIDLKSSSIGIDIVFPEKADELGDQRLASLAEISPVTFAYVLDYENRENLLASGKLPQKIGSSIHLSRLDSTQAYGYISNHAGLSHAKCTGNIGYIPDIDGKVRYLPANSFFNGEYHPTFSESLLNCAGIIIKIPEKNYPKWKLKYSTDLNSLIFISASDILRSRIPNDFLKNKHVLIGSSSLALGDRVSTPLAPLVPGVTVHAAALIDLLDIHDGIHQFNFKGNYLVILFDIFCIFLIWVSIKKYPPWISVLTILTLCTTWLLFSFFIKTKLNIEHSTSAPFLGLLLVSLFVLPQEWWNVKRREIKLKNIFSNYVGKSVLDQIINSKSEKSLNPSLIDITVLVVDMQGYTNRVMSLSIEDSALLTREFLSRITPPITNNQGTLDKYMGDGLIAFWGAPLANDRKEDLAISCAIEILKNIEAWNQENAYNNTSPIKVRIGIESGLAVVGDLGTDFRSTYTAVGDCINVASRLETLAKNLSSPIAIGPNTQKKSKRNDLISLGKYQLRDTDNTIEVFTISSTLSKIK